MCIDKLLIPKTKQNGSSRHKAPLSQSETKAENRKKLYEGGSIFLEELCSLPMTQRAAEAVMEIKAGNTLFGSFGALAATAGLFVANACVSPVKIATSVVAKTTPTAAAFVDSTAAVLLESVETALPVIGSDPVKVAKRLKYRSVKTMYDAARCVVKSQVGQCALRTVNTLVEGAEVLLAYVAPLDSCEETPEEPGDGLRTEEDPGDHKGTQTPASPKPEAKSLICRVLALPIRATLMVTKPIQRTMVYFAKSRRYRKTGRTPCRETRASRKSLVGRPRASPKKRASKPEQPPFYRRLVTSLLVTLRIMNPPQPEDAPVQPPNYVFDPNTVPSPRHKFAKRSHDDVGSDDGTLSDILGDLEDYCSDDDPNYEWDSSDLGEEYDSFEYMTDSFSDLEEELDFVEKEASTNILEGLQGILDKTDVDNDGDKNCISDSELSKATVTKQRTAEVIAPSIAEATEPNMAEVTKGVDINGRIKARNQDPKVTARCGDTKTAKKCFETIETNTSTPITCALVMGTSATVTNTVAAATKTSTTSTKTFAAAAKTTAAATKTSTTPTETAVATKKKGAAVTNAPSAIITNGDKTGKSDAFPNNNNATNSTPDDTAKGKFTNAAPLTKNVDLPPPK